MKPISDPIDKPVILALDASADSCSAALWQQGQLVVVDKVAARHGHAARLAGMARAVWEQAGCDFGSITHIAACIGPGSFTGIRTCLAAATGFVLAGTARPAGISGFAASYGAVRSQLAGQPVWLLADTRRASFHACLFGPDGKAGPVREWPDAELAACLGQAGPAAGDKTVIAGPPSLLDRLDQPAGISACPVELDAGLIAAEAARLIGDGPDLPPLQPLYLSEPILGQARQTDGKG